MKRTHPIALLAVLLSGAAVGAAAQAPAGPAAAQPELHAHARHGGERGFDPARMHERMQERMARRLAKLKQKLAIAPAQEAAWNAWTQAMQPPANLQRLDRGELAQLSTPERIDRRRAQRAARMAEMDRRGEATKAFYAALDAEQRKTFDEATARLGKRGHGGRHRHRHGG